MPQNIYIHSLCIVEEEKNKIGNIERGFFLFGTQWFGCFGMWEMIGFSTVELWPSMRILGISRLCHGSRVCVDWNGHLVSFTSDVGILAIVIACFFWLWGGGSWIISVQAVFVSASSCNHDFMLFSAVLFR